MECNKEMLGLINFEFVSLPAFEVAQRNIPIVVQDRLKEEFEESFEDQSFR